MSKYQAYPEYKDSGNKLLGKIPSDWKVLRYKNILKIMQGMAFKSIEYVDNSSVVNVRMGNIKKGGHLDLGHNTKYLPEKYKDTYSEYQLNDGDAIIAMTDMSPSLEFLAVPAILDGLDENVTYLLNQRVGKLILNKEFDIRFVRYWLLSDELRSQLKSEGLGTVQANMSNDDLYEAYFFCPLISERLKIVEFLDHETAKIDILIYKQQQLIQLLKEKRQAVISHAVTKGLNPNAPMRDSGVEWLGEVPEHWEMVPLKHLCKFSGGGTPSKDNLSYWTNGHIPWVSPKDMKIFWLSDSQDKLTDIAVQESSTNYVEAGALLMVVRSGILQRTIPIAINTVEVTLNQDMKALRFNERMEAEYAANYILGNISSLLLEWTKEGATVESIEQEYLSNGLIPVPPKSEQTEINKVIEEQMTVFEALESKAVKGIRLLQERRTALISAAVTGKVDVRNWESPDSAQNKEAV